MESIFRYKHFGWMMSSRDEVTNLLTSKIYWCFFELQNGRILDLMHIEEWDQDGHPLGPQYQVTYTGCFDFNEDFYTWWDKTFEFRESEFDQGFPEQALEDDLVNFYKSMIEPNADRPTEVVLIT